MNEHIVEIFLAFLGYYQTTGKAGSPEARGRSQSPAGDAEPVSRKKADIKPWNLRDTPGKGTRIFHQSVFKKGHLP